MQIAAGVEGYRGVFRLDRLGRFRCHHILLQVHGGQAVALAELLAGCDKFGVVFQAGQVLIVVQ
jgi:hypothetical protein